uniref:Uncharacterized protein n=1 Tax=Anopheles arabiensis TaxID=7173 RepID=A0A182IGF5_ANOAR
MPTYLDQSIFSLKILHSRKLLIH